MTSIYHVLHAYEFAHSLEYTCTYRKRKQCKKHLHINVQYMHDMLRMRSGRGPLRPPGNVCKPKVTYSERSWSDQLRWHSSGRALAQDRDEKKRERPIGAEMGEQKCCSTHKVVQPWAVDAVSLWELPVCESLTDNDGSSSRTIHLGR